MVFWSSFALILGGLLPLGGIAALALLKMAFALKKLKVPKSEKIIIGCSQLLDDGVKLVS